MERTSTFLLILALALVGCTNADEQAQAGTPATMNSPAANDPEPCADFERGPSHPYTADALAPLTRELDRFNASERATILDIASSSIVASPDESFASADAWIRPGIAADRSVFSFAGNRSDGTVVNESFEIAHGLRTIRVGPVHLDGSALEEEAHEIAAENGSRTGHPTSAAERFLTWHSRDPGCVTIVYREPPGPHVCEDGVCRTPGYTTVSIAEVDLGRKIVIAWKDSWG